MSEQKTTLGEILLEKPKSRETSKKVYIPYDDSDRDFAFVREYTSTKNTDLLKEQIGVFIMALQKNPAQVAKVLREIINS